MKRSQRRRIDDANAAIAKAENRILKAAERRRRNARMIAKLKAGSLPYTPVVMNWLVRQLAKRAGKITQQDVQALLT
ncbi:MAG: hypothetical protein JSU63_16480 [Phycisphaerales bacterium]|nr:MAG: hypothetical protein JSU63_16480 [Phycisphaerales bacterium]